ncbi:MAG: hypothetical protein R3313_04485 [Candidatus Saccharimonadales bacterium]|nr:hypothetical protein [Candidatus Saccharimonadales bacterium]
MTVENRTDRLNQFGFTADEASSANVIYGLSGDWEVFGTNHKPIVGALSIIALEAKEGEVWLIEDAIPYLEDRNRPIPEESPEMLDAISATLLKRINDVS